MCPLPPRALPAYGAAVYDVIGVGACADADGSDFESFWKRNLTETECSGFCTREPKCGGYYHVTNGIADTDGNCHVLGAGLAQPDGWSTAPGNGGVWPIAKVKSIGRGTTCYRKVATTTGNVR